MRNLVASLANKKPALGGLEEAQALRGLSDAQNDTSNLVSSQAADPKTRGSCLTDLERESASGVYDPRLRVSAIAVSAR